MTPNTIEFHSTDDDTWVMRITADRKIEVNEDVDVTFAAQKVLDALQVLLTPHRKPLTDKEIVDAIQHLYQNRDVAEMAAKVGMEKYRAIEAAHGIKE